jgi:ABC-type glycerol-3-phosphate transport system substrate-binding protein
VKEKGGSGLVLLPGGSPFFLDQLVGELVANAGGRLYDPNTSRWQFEGAEVRRVFEFLLSLKTEGLLDPNWAGQTYPDQFPRLAKIDGPLVTPVTYARAAVAIRKLLSDDDGGSRASDATGDVFRFMSQPVFPGAPVSGSVATIDCEPYVIFAGPAQQKFAGKPRRELSIDFLRRFYKDSNYLDFTKSVPIHLTPIFRDLAKNPEYLATIGKWSNWHAHTMRFLETPGRTRPILVPGSSPESLEADLKNPYLLDLQAQNVISNAVAEMLTANQNPDLTKILRGVQDRATSLSSGR